MAVANLRLLALMNTLVWVAEIGGVKLKKEEFRAWMTAQGYKPNSVSTMLSVATKIEEAYSLDEEFERDECEGLLGKLAYSAADAALGKPNPTDLELWSDLVRDLSNLRTTVRVYVRFRRGETQPQPRFALIDANGAQYVPSRQQNRETGKLAFRVKPKGASNRTEDALECETLDELVRAVLLEKRPARFEPADGGTASYLTYGNSKIVGYEADPALADRLGIPVSLSIEPPLEPAIWFVTARDGENDGTERFVREGFWSLLPNVPRGEYNELVGQMKVGDTIVLRNASTRSQDLPFKANGATFSYMRIRATGTVTGASTDGISVQVSWRPEEERYWYFYNTTRTVWRLPDGSVSAAKLRDFILVGTPQDYDWFLKHPYWGARLNRVPEVTTGMADILNVSHALHPTNLILYGPPGTGKTYRTAQEAVRLCDGDVDYGEDAEGRAALMQRYGELVKEKRIEFVTFHQSFGYEDFVEGLRPVTGASDGQTAGGFELKPEAGIFRRLADRAAAPVMKADEAFSLEDRSVFKLSLGEAGKAQWQWVFEDSLEESCAIFGFKDIDWSDSRFEDRDAMLRELQERFPEESFTVQNGDVKSPYRFRNQISEGDVLIVSKGLNAFRAIGVVEGPYEYAPRPGGSYCHRRKVRWLWDDPDGVDVRDISEKRFSLDTVYELPKSRLNTAEIERLVNAAAASGVEDQGAEHEPHVLIIDEINRANISKVFGELITLLEPDKRIGQANALTVRLPYSKREFGVPSNLHVIGTMNTADRSIALLDTALRRRFRFEEIAPDPALLKTVDGIPLQQVLTVINQRIEYLIDRDHRIGHAYFMSDGGRSRAAIDTTMRDKVIPLLQEYFFEDWSRIASVVGDGFLERTVLPPPPGINGEARNSWAVRPTFLADAYERLLKGSLPDEGATPPSDEDIDE